MNMKQHSTKRRVLSILLSAMMLLSMIPAAVFQSSAAANAWDDYTNEAEGGWHFFVDEIGEATFTWTDSPYLSALLNGPGNWVNNSDWFCDWLSRDEYPGDVFYAVLGKNTMATANTWMDGSMNDGSEGNIANGNYTGLNKKLYAQFGGFMWTVTNGYLVTLNADDFDLTFQGPGTAMGNKDDAAVVINKGHMSFTDGIVVTNISSGVAVDVKSGGVIDLISDATIGAEGSQIGLRNEGTITSITGGTFYNFDNKGTVGSITGGTFDYSQAPEGVSFEQIRGAVAENATVDEISAGVFQVTSEEDPGPGPEPEDPNWDYIDAGRGDGSIEITNYKGGVGAVTVPAEINGHKVVGLGNGALYQKGITSLVISEGIEYLGDDAVMFNNEMTSMTLPSTLNTVGDNCFALAYALTNVDLPEACVNFVDDPEYDCALGGSKNNGLGIFYGLGDNGNSISEPGAATVTCYTEEAKAALEAGNARNAELGMDTYTINYVQQGVEDPTWEYADSGRGDGTIEITGYKGAYGASVVVPSTINDQRVVGVADLVAYDQGLTSITISEGIEYIGAYAFGWLPGEGQGTSITLPSTLTTLGHGAFVAPFYLSNVTIPEACVNFPDAPEGVETSNGVALDAFFGAGYLSGGCTVTVYTETARDFFQTVSNAMVAETYPALNIVYEAPEVPVTVTFDANGGENAPAAAEVNANEAYTLPGAGEMTRENYIFAGWALSADATAEDVVTEITPTESMTVYAVWTEVTAPCEHPEDQRTLVVDTEPGYYFHGVGHIVCDECGATIEEDVDIEPLPLTDAYNDVNPDGWYVPGVAMMTDLGIMSGKGDGIFDPDGTMLRSEMAMTMYQMLADPEEDLSDVELPFTDVSEDHWAINAIKWCYKHGIVSGATTTTFEPDSQILREQFVSMFYRYMVSEMTEEEYQEMVAGIDQTILDQFPDGAAIDDYAVEAMQVFVQAGVITGSDGMLAARGACSRGQVAQILRTILELGME